MSGIASAARGGLSLLWSRRWVFAVPVATLLLPTALYVVHLPDTFKATAFVRIKPMSAERVGGALPVGQEARAEQILATARDRVLAQHNVAALIPVLWPKGNPADTYTIQQARGRVSYDQVGEAGFNVSIEDPVPARAAAGVNRLLESFLENERAARLKGAETRSEFHAKELASAQESYGKLLTQYEEFGRTHAETMPELKDATVSQLSRVEAEAREREGQASMARRYLQEWDKLILQPAAAPGPQGTPALSAEEQQLGLQLSGQQAALDKATQQLAELRGKFTDKWEPVQAAARDVETLKGAIEKTKRDLDAARKKAAANAREGRVADSRGILDALQRQRAEFAVEEERATKAAAELRERAAQLQSRLAAMPATELALRPLRRALEEAERLLKARETSAADARQAAAYYLAGDTLDTTGFGVDQWAAVPFTPSGPARSRWLATAMALGLALGYAIHRLRRRFDEGALRSPEDFADLVPGALVVAVPILGEHSTRRSGRVLDVVCGGWVLACVAGTVLALGAHKGWFPAPVWLQPWLGTHA